MFEREKQFNNLFKTLRRWAKRPLYTSYTRGYTAGLGDREPARKTCEYISSLDDSSISIEEKISLIYSFLESKGKEQRSRPGMGSPYYNNLLIYIRQSLKNIEHEKPVQTKML